MSIPRLAAACVFGAVLAGAAHGAPPSEAADPRGFDPTEALGISQAALGRAVGNHVLIRRDGTRRQLADFRGEPLVVSMIFTSCAHICPATTRHLRRAVAVARDALGHDSFRVVTVGFDAARDTPETMTVFARRQGIDVNGWEFLSADRETIAQLASDLGFVYFRSGGGFDHLIQSTIIDAEGVVYRQIYGIDFRIPHLVEPLKELVFGARPERSLYQSLTDRIRLFCTVYDPASDSYRFNYDIFIGLVIGLGLGTVAMVLVIREWQHHSAGEARP